MTGDEIGAREGFHLAFHYYVRSLRVLAMSPEAACEAYGHYNVAGELWREGDGAYLMENMFCPLTEGQRRGIESLAARIKELPIEAIRFTNIKPESLELLSHPAWEVPRKDAIALLETLKPIIRVNEEYFEVNARGPNISLQADRER